MTEIERLQKEHVQLCDLIRKQKRELDEMRGTIDQHRQEIDQNNMALVLLQRSQEANIDHISILAEELEVEL